MKVVTQTVHTESPADIRTGNHHHHHHHHHVKPHQNHQKAGNGSLRSNGSACDKAARRLSATLAKTRRWGLRPADVENLPASRKLLAQIGGGSYDRDWRFACLLVTMFAGGVVLTLLYYTTAIAGGGRTCRIEDINLAT